MPPDDRLSPLLELLRTDPSADRLLDDLLGAGGERWFVVASEGGARTLLAASDTSLRAWGQVGGAFGRPLDEVALGPDAVRLREAIEVALAEGRSEHATREVGRAVRYRLRALPTADGALVVARGEDESRVRELEGSLSAAGGRLRGALECIGGAAAFVDAGGRVLVASPAWADAGARGLPCPGEGRSMLDAVERVAGADRLAATLAAQIEPDSLGAALDLPLGDPPRWWRWRLHPGGADGGAVVVVAEASDDLLGANELRTSRRDPLTGLANRRAFDEEMGRLAGESGGPSAALVLIDLDGLPELNRAAGHAAGDAVLCEVARRLDAVARKPRDLVARLGGDEFVVVAIGLGPAETEAVERLAARVAEVLAEPWAVPAATGVRCSVGVSCSMAPVDSSAVLWEATRALAEARRAGGAAWKAAWSLER